MKRMLVALILALGLASVSWAQVPGDGPDVDKNRPMPPSANPTPDPIQPLAIGSDDGSQVGVGDTAPDFDMESSLGKVVRLADLKGHWSVLVFDESPAALGSFKDIAGDLSRAGVSLYGIGRDAPETLRTYADRERLPFVLLSDLTRQISQAYGMFDGEDGSIQPGMVVLDPKAVVQMAVFGQSLHPAEVLQLVLHVVKGT
jgi:peroxiredoxin Q/BCP